MTHDRPSLEAAHLAAADAICVCLDAKQTVAYLCLGDIGLYGSYYYIHRIVRARGHSAQIVPGVSSLSAVSARVERPLALGNERLLVVPATDGALEEALDFPANKAFVKLGRTSMQLGAALAERDEYRTVVAVERCGLDEERVLERPEEVARASYLTVALHNPGWNM